MKRVLSCVAGVLMALAFINFAPATLGSIPVGSARAGEVVDVAPEVAAESAAEDAAASAAAAAASREATAEAEQEAATAARQAASQATEEASQSASNAASRVSSRTLRPVYAQNHFLLYYVLFVHAKANGDRYKCEVSKTHKVKSCTDVSSEGGNLPTFVWIILGGIVLVAVIIAAIVGLLNRAADNRRYRSYGY